MQLTTAAITQSNGGPSPTRTRNPQSRVPKFPGPCLGALRRNRNVFRRDTAAWSRHTHEQKDNAETPTGCIGVPKSDVDALSRDLGTQKGNADVEKITADAEKGNADAQKINVFAQKDNVFARSERPNGLICSSLHASRIQNQESGIQHPATSI